MPFKCSKSYKRRKEKRGDAFVWYNGKTL